MKKFEVGYAGEGKEEEMGGMRKNLRGCMPEREKKTKCRGGVAEKMRGGGVAVYRRG